MAGILCTHGPVSTLKSVQRLSRIFNTAVRKTRFLSAANQLQDAQLGKLVVLEGVGKSLIFIKKEPAQARELLTLPQNSDLCTPEEYEERFSKPPSCVITEKLMTILISLGHVPAEHFKTKVKAHKESNVANFETLDQYEPYPPM